MAISVKSAQTGITLQHVALSALKQFLVTGRAVEEVSPERFTAELKAIERLSARNKESQKGKAG